MFHLLDDERVVNAYHRVDSGGVRTVDDVLFVSCKEPGIKTAPILWIAVASTQYSHRRRRISMTTEPFWTPRDFKKFAALLERRFISVKVRCFSFPWSSHQTSAILSFSAAAQPSTMSNPKLKCSGTVTS